MEEAIDIKTEEPAFSSENLALFNIDDIDSEDVDDPQLVVQYVNEIYQYMRHMEKAQAIKKEYLNGRIGKCLLRVFLFVISGHYQGDLLNVWRSCKSTFLLF